MLLYYDHTVKFKLMKLNKIFLSKI